MIKGLVAVALTLFLGALVHANRLNLANPCTRTHDKPFKNWGLKAIDVTEAWMLTDSPKKVRVAVVDAGVNLNNKFLRDSAAPRQCDWDFVTKKSSCIDKIGHGTHVAGIIGSVRDVEVGISGVAPNVELMSVRYYSNDATGAENLVNSVKALDYAIEHGARIINYSGGGPVYDPEELRVLEKALMRDVLVVAAAGNDHQNLDDIANTPGFFPASYGLSNILTVSGSTYRGKLCSSSNWGRKSVDVVAPGENILSTVSNDKLAYMTGTSQATAFVTGIAALLLSEDPELNPQQIKCIIKESVDLIPAFKDAVSSGGQVNACRSVLTLKRVLARAVNKHAFDCDAVTTAGGNHEHR